MSNGPPVWLTAVILAGAVATKGTVDSIQSDKKEFSSWKGKPKPKYDGVYRPANANEGDKILENQEYGWYNPAGWFAEQREKSEQEIQEEKMRKENLPNIEGFVCPLTKKTII